MTSSKKSEVIDLTTRFNQGRRQLLEQLFEEHSVALRNFVRGRIRQRDDLDDVVQEVFARLMKTEGLEEKMTSATGSNRSFLLSMANNIIVDLERHRQVCRRYSLTQAGAESERTYEITPEISASASRELRMIKKVIMDLRPDWRKAFVLNRFKHLSYREVAVAMGVSIKQVEHYMAKAIAQIRKVERHIGRKEKGYE